MREYPKCNLALGGETQVTEQTEEGHTEQLLISFGIPPVRINHAYSLHIANVRVQERYIILNHLSQLAFLIAPCRVLKEIGG